MPRSYGLFDLVEWIAGIAFLIALWAGSGGTSTWTVDFSSLPANDSQLEAWLDARGHHDVRVSRDQGSVTLERKTGPAVLPRFADLPDPPWQRLGYPTPNGTRGTHSWQAFSGSPRLWLVGAALLIAISAFRRRATASSLGQRRPST